MLETNDTFLFDDQDDETKEILRFLGFEEGEDVFKVFDDFLERNNLTLADYFPEVLDGQRIYTNILLNHKYNDFDIILILTTQNKNKH
jgi:hypothetical protein